MPKNHKLTLLDSSHAPGKKAMGQKEITALVEDELKLVEVAILENFQSDVAIIPLISNYLANGGGKRLRPILVMLISRLFGHSGGEELIIHSTVVEYIHAATLLHDDVVDKADVRRGIKSANAKWGNGYSVLVGDYLFAKSFSLMAQNSTVDIINTVSDTTRYLAEGEILQLLNRYDPEVTEEKYLDIVFRKTGALITTSCMIGAFLGNSTPKQREAVEIYGKNVGIAFQITDDVLDFKSDEKTLGKPVGHDIEEGHVTLPFIHAYGNADPEERKFMSDSVKEPKLTPQTVRKVISLVEKYDGIGYAERLAFKHVDRAINALEGFEPGVYRDALAGLAEYITNRTF